MSMPNTGIHFVQCVGRTSILRTGKPAGATQPHEFPPASIHRYEQTSEQQSCGPWLWYRGRGLLANNRTTIHFVCLDERDLRIDSAGGVLNLLVRKELVRRESFIKIDENLSP